jgi:hypothetical protein
LAIAASLLALGSLAAVNGPVWAGGKVAAGGSGPRSDTPRCGPYTNFSPENFENSARIDNRWLPLLPGTRYVLTGRANRGGGLLPHTVSFTVTDLTKVINGVKTRVLYDLDINEGVLSEAELAFHAQDEHGSVWNMGEYPEEYDNGKFVGAPSTWLAGQAGAKAGVVMPGKPRLGTPPYRHGFALSVGFYDCAQIFKKHQTANTPYRNFTNVLVTDEWSPLDPASGHQLKYHAPGVGIVQVGAVNDPEGETLVLTSIQRLSPAQLNEVRKAAFKLEARAYKISNVYQRTAPMKVG